MSRHGGDPVAMTVVRFLGIASVVGLLVVGALCFVALQYEQDGSTVAVIAIVGNLASASLASLGSILASTGKGAPQPVTVEQPANKPVPTTDSPSFSVAPSASDGAVNPDL